MTDFSDFLKDYTFDLPENLIAQSPSRERVDAKLLVVRRNPERGLPRFENLCVNDLPSLIDSTPELRKVPWVRNLSRVFPARFYARRPSGGRHEIVLLEAIDNFSWKAIIRGVASFKFPQTLTSDGAVQEQICFTCPEAGVVRFEISQKSLVDWLWRHGEMPLPPYIKSRDASRDKNRYQAVWADPEQNKSAAAPTASLHFDTKLELTLKNRGVSFLNTYLHVGLGTFEPVRAEKLSEHTLHSEKIFIPSDSVQTLKNPEQPCLAVGTTALRTLESAACFLNAPEFSSRDEMDIRFDQHQNILGSTRLFVRPGYKFQRTKYLWTNFHLPESTLFVLVCCFAGSRSLALDAYRYAIQNKYRFFSYGDASLWI